VFFFFEGKGHHHTSLLSPLHLFYSFVSTIPRRPALARWNRVCGYSTEGQQRKNTKWRHSRI
jgi:hypothetical protein